jgi:hypothetical protein
LLESMLVSSSTTVFVISFLRFAPPISPPIYRLT